MTANFAIDQTGGQLQNRWEEKGSIEVFFRNGFVSHYPWGECLPLQDTRTVHVERLCHVTHRAQAREIITYDRDTMKMIYTFQPHERMGKCLFNEWIPGRSLGHSYGRNEFDVPNPNTNYGFIPTAQHLLPEGRYSFWSIDEENPQGSMYGTCKFSFSFQYMLERFCHARATEHDPEPILCFKKAGTLRYRREICYVVLVCVNTDPNVQHLPPLTEAGGHVTLNGMLDDNGIWNGEDLNFVYNERSYEERNWEHLVFGFFFGPNLELVLEKEAYDKVNHGLCIRKTRIEGKWMCPDEVPDEHENQLLENEPEIESSESDPEGDDEN